VISKFLRAIIDFHGLTVEEALIVIEVYMEEQLKRLTNQRQTMHTFHGEFLEYPFNEKF
jgi:hypothetical protein